jgi:replicative DNA helicase
LDSARTRSGFHTVGAFGPRVAPALRLAATLPRAASNVDTLPAQVWDTVSAEMRTQGLTQREMAALRGTSYGGSAHMSFAPTRATVRDYAERLHSQKLSQWASGDLFWDRVTAVAPDGEEEVYDLTVPGPANWLADGLVTHNSGAIEQDADLVMFIYRDEYYNKESTRAGEADIILAKHRNGAVGEITLTFQSEFPKFMNYAGARFEG